jgi:hypothetical protein
MEAMRTALLQAVIYIMRALAWPAVALSGHG